MGKIVGDILFWMAVIVTVFWCIFVVVSLFRIVYEILFSNIPGHEGIILQRRMKKNAGRFQIQ